MLRGQTSSGRFTSNLLIALLWSICMFILAACGQGSSSTDQPAGSGEQLQTNELSALADGDGVDAEDALNPLVSAGEDQFADANVVIALTGTAEAQAGATIASVQWQQLSGPEVVIANVNSLSNIITVPDTTEPDLMVFALQASDTAGRTGEDFTVISILPLKVFARVISTTVDENVGTALIRVELSGPSPNDTFLSYKSIDGSAIGGVDYIPVAGELIIPAGQTSAQLAIELIDDGLQEADETLLLQVAIENGDDRNTGTGTVIIRNGADTSGLVEQVIAFDNSGPVEGNVGASVTNTVSDNPQTAPGSGAITYSSSNPLVATVDAVSGEATLLAPGSTVITAFKEADNLYASAQTSYNLKVNLLAQEITFTQPGPLSGFINEVISNPVDNSGSGEGAIIIASSNPELATVDAASGEVTLLAAGSVIITATKAADDLYGEAQASYELTIKRFPQTLEFTLPGPVSGALGQTITNPLSAEGEGSGAVTYSSGDTAVATVDEISGEVELLSVGSVVITATKAADTLYATATASYTINVGLVPQTLVFEQPGPVQLALEQTFTNTVGATPGSGAVVYTSSNPAVAAVDAGTGLVEVLATGSATITATKAADALYAEATASYDITVALQAQNLSFEDSGPVTGYIGSNLFNPLLNAGEGTGAITYFSSDTSIVQVDSGTGEVALKKLGSVVITAVKEADSLYAEASASYQLLVTLNPQTIAFTQTAVTVAAGEAFVQLLSESGQGTGNVVFSSNNSAVASVDSSSGMVNPKAAGTAVITATKAADNFYGGASASYTLTVIDSAQTIEFAENVLTVYVGDSFANELVETGVGEGAITYQSSNTLVASIGQVSGNGTANSLGTAIITATKAADDLYESASDTYTVNVILKPQNLVFQNPGPVDVYIEEYSYLNPLIETGEGSGAITYTESDADVGSVYSDGTFYIYSSGTVTITATKAADSVYASATASYTLNVVP